MSARGKKLRTKLQREREKFWRMSWPLSTNLTLRSILGKDEVVTAAPGRGQWDERRGYEDGIVKDRRKGSDVMCLVVLVPLDSIFGAHSLYVYRHAEHVYRAVCEITYIQSVTYLLLQSHCHLLVLFLYHGVGIYYF